MSDRLTTKCENTDVVVEFTIYETSNIKVTLIYQFSGKFTIQNNRNALPHHILNVKMYPINNVDLPILG